MGLCLLLLVFMRVPSLFYNHEINCDESQVITQALSLARNPVYGQAVDGTTIGPINNYLLLLPAYLGFPFDYTTSRVVALLLLLVSLVLFDRGLRDWVSPLARRLTLTVVTVFFAWSTQADFLHYSSELTSFPLIILAFNGAIRLFHAKRPSLWGLFGIGLIAGIVPYCKLQTLPIIGAIGLVVVLFLICTQLRQSLRAILTLAAGFVLPNLVVFGLAESYGVTGDLITYYFVGNLKTYSGIYADVPMVQQSFFWKLVKAPIFFSRLVDFLLTLVCYTVAAVIGMLLVVRSSDAAHRRQMLFTWTHALVLATLLSALFATIRPGTQFAHHLLLMVFPMGWLTAVGLHLISQSSVPALRQRLYPAFVISLPILLLGQVFVYSSLYSLRPWLKNAPLNFAMAEPTTGYQKWLYHVNPYLASFPNYTDLTLSPVSQTVQRYTKPGDYLAVWGWNCQFYVETQLAQGVSESHSQRSIVPNPMQDMYQKRYVSELITNRPAVFLDAVGMNSMALNSPKQRHENFATVSKVIREQYTQVADLQYVRVYVRQDRLTAKTAVPKPAFVPELGHALLSR